MDMLRLSQPMLRLSQPLAAVHLLGLASKFHMAVLPVARVCRLQSQNCGFLLVSGL